MPSDLLGASIFDKEKSDFVLHRGPVFADIVLADEINRAPPRAQSALLEAMAEGRVSIDGETLDLAPEFFVMATQNPFGQIGTFPLPESQFDRFLIRVEFGDLERGIERDILIRGDRSATIPDLPDLSASLPRGGAAIAGIHMAEPVLDYVQECLAGETGALGVNCNMRWVGSLVAEAHRILARGGDLPLSRRRAPGIRDRAAAHGL
jgi:MoxR-like ATPase